LRSRSFSKSESQTKDSRTESQSRTSIYICPVPWSCTRQKLARVFSIFGETNGATILTKTRGRRNPDGCVGFVDFKRNNSARRSIQEYNGIKMRMVFSSYKGESRLSVRFSEATHARTGRPARGRIGRPRRRAARSLSPRDRIRRRDRSQFSSRSRSRSRTRKARRELSISINKLVKEESSSRSERSKSRPSRDKSIFKELSRTKSRNRYRFSSEESTKFSDSEVQNKSQRSNSVKSLHEPLVPSPAGENIVVSYNKNERMVLIKPSSESQNPEKLANDYNSLHKGSSTKHEYVSDEYASLSMNEPPGVSPADNTNYKARISSRPEVIVRNSSPHAVQPVLEKDMELQEVVMKESQNHINSMSPLIQPQCVLQPPRSLKPEPTSVYPSVDQHAEEDLRLSSMDEIEEENFKKFKNQRTRIRWQTYQQHKGQIKLLETKNLGMEDDLLQLEGQCRYWKDKFKDTLREYSASKDELRNARRFSFEEQVAIS